MIDIYILPFVFLKNVVHFQIRNTKRMTKEIVISVAAKALPPPPFSLKTYNICNNGQCYIVRLGYIVRTPPQKKKPKANNNLSIVTPPPTCLVWIN